MLSIKAHTIQGPEGQLATLEAGGGAGLPALFLHADSGSAGQWQEVLQRIASERRAVAFDFRGNGASPPAANEDYGYAGRAEDVAAVADRLGLERFVLVAHSGGAAVALEYASTHADRAAGLLLIDPPSDPRALPGAVKEGMLRDMSGPRSLEAQKAFYASIAGADPAVRERVLADCERGGAAARKGVALALVEWNPEPTLNAWRGPIFILAGTANDNGHALYDLRPEIPHAVIEEVGHWIQLEKPDLVEQTFRRFVAELERSKG